MKREIDIKARNWNPSLLPGPIALVTTKDNQGHVNIAPKSWISFVTDKIMVIGCHRDHHTAKNLLENGECVLNFPGEDIIGKVWRSSQFMQPNPEEPAKRGFTMIPSTVVAPPSIQECRSYMECKLESVKWYGDDCVLFVECVAASVKEEINGYADPYAYLQPVFFLAPSTYGVIERAHTI